MKTENMKPLVLFGCVHIGHRNADLEMAKEYVKAVKDSGAYALLLSDNFENVIPKKGHMMYDQVLTPQQQLDYGEDLFRPIRKQIMGIVQGNHSNRTRHEAGIDMDYQLAKALGIKDRYNPNQGFVALRVGKQTYSVAYKHGTGFGSNTFGNCTTLMRAFPSADICACSHTHEIAATTKGFWEIQNGKRVMREVTLVNTGSLLAYPSYADEAYYSPQKKGFAVAYLASDEKRVIVDVSGSLQ
jgi:hypothetical protein